MAIRKVAVMGHPVLRLAATPVPEAMIKSPKVQQLLSDMLDTMYEYNGLGLAAPQVYESLQIVVMIWDFEQDQEPYIRYLINPVITNLTKEESGHWEGCLSVPGLRGWVSRPNRISVKAFDDQGKAIEFIAEGFAATVIQHECDHLLGKLYLDRMTEMEKLVFESEFKKHIRSEDESTAE